MIGELSDKGLSEDGKMVARIDDVPFTCIPKTYPFLEKLERGYQVEYNLNADNQIEKIWRAKKPAPQKAGDGFTTAQKMKAAGFNMPETESVCKSCTRACIDRNTGKASCKDYTDKGPASEVMTGNEVAALKARADEAQREKSHNEEMAAKSKEAKEQPKDDGLPKTVEGKTVNINHQARTFTLRPDGGFGVDLTWGPGHDAKMEKFKENYKAKVTYETGKPAGRLIDITSGFKKDGAYGGKGNYQPRNEKIIVLQSSLKVCADLFQYCTTPDTQDYEAACDLVYNTALAMTEKIMKDTVMK